jgi:hypothetical protein
MRQIMTLNLPSLEALKAQAKRLRGELQSDGHSVSHSRSLELLAHQYGFRDWNGLHAALGNRARSGPPVSLGERVSGRYLGQSFEGEVIGVHSLSAPDRYRVTVTFDEPVDVVTFDSFSAFRSRVTSVIDRNGASAEKTSNGQPQMQLSL